jgi:SanA protein
MAGLLFFKIRRRHVVVALGLAALLILAAIVFSKTIIDRQAACYVFDEVGNVPACRVGLVLGCSRELSDGRPNLFFLYRVNGAAELYRAGKVQRLIVSGDNHIVTYDEPTDMKAALMRRGVPDEHIICDYAGFSTLDSVVRAREVFGQTQLIVVSQEFHNKRAVFIGRSNGIEVYGFNVADVAARFAVKTTMREALARVKTVLDVWILNRQPKFLGDSIRI